MYYLFPSVHLLPGQHFIVFLCLRVDLPKVTLTTNVRECQFSGIMKQFKIHEYSVAFHGQGDMKDNDYDDERVRMLRLYRAEYVSAGASFF